MGSLLVCAPLDVRWVVNSTLGSRHVLPVKTANRPIIINHKKTNENFFSQSSDPVMRLLISSAVILGLWQMVVVIFEMPSFILPAPAEVFLKSNVDEPDGLDGISAHLQVLDLNQQILSHRKAGRWTAVQNWYEIKLAKEPANTDAQIDLLHCLKQAGQHGKDS